MNIVGAMPFNDFSNSTEGMAIPNRISLGLPANIAASVTYGMAKYIMKEGEPFNENMVSNPNDQRILKENPEMAIKLGNSMKEAFKKDRIIGVRDDFKLLKSSNNWGGFELKQICNEYNRFQQIFVHSIYGLNDTNVPPTHGQFIDNYFENLRLEFKEKGIGNFFFACTL